MNQFLARVSNSFNPLSCYSCRRSNYQNKQIFSFRPDICLFVNGIYLGYSELKSNLSNQTARQNGRSKVIKDYFEAVKAYYETFDNNPQSDKEKDYYRKDFLKISEKAIHITSTDIGETYVIRTIDHFFDEILTTCREGKYDREEYEKKVMVTSRMGHSNGQLSIVHDQLSILYIRQTGQL